MTRKILQMLKVKWLIK